jgi:hypothetical protein
MKKRLLAVALMGLLASSVVSVAPASAGSICNNGSYSANSGRGTCSYNGGVNKQYQSYSDPGSSSWNRSNGLGSSSSYGSSSKNGLGSSSSYGSSSNNGLGSSSSFGSSSKNGLGSTSSYGSSLNSKRSCYSLRC